MRKEAEKESTKLNKKTRIVKLFTQHVVRGDYWVPTNCSLTVNGGVASLIAWLDHSCQKTEVGGKQGHAPCRKISLQ